MAFTADEDLIINSGDPAAYAKQRLALGFRTYLLETLKAFSQSSKDYRQLRDYFAQGGGASWEDIIKAVEDDSEQGRNYVELFRQLVEAELHARNVVSNQVEKPIPKWY